MPADDIDGDTGEGLNGPWPGRWSHLDCLGQSRTGHKWASPAIISRSLIGCSRTLLAGPSKVLASSRARCGKVFPRIGPCVAKPPACSSGGTKGETRQSRLESWLEQAARRGSSRAGVTIAFSTAGANCKQRTNTDSFARRLCQGASLYFPMVIHAYSYLFNLSLIFLVINTFRKHFSWADGSKL